MVIIQLYFYLLFSAIENDKQITILITLFKESTRNYEPFNDTKYLSLQKYRLMMDGSRDAFASSPALLNYY